MKNANMQRRGRAAVAPSDPRHAPLTVAREVCDYDGRRLGFVFMSYDGTPEGARRVAQTITAEMFETYGGVSNVNSRIIATGADGQPAWAISPNFAHVAEFGTDEARYILGDVSAAPARASAPTSRNVELKNP